MNLVASTALSLVVAHTAFAKPSTAPTDSTADRAATLILAQADGCAEGQAPIGEGGACVDVEVVPAPEEEQVVEEPAAPVEEQPEEPVDTPAEEPAVEEPAAEEPPAVEEPAVVEEAPAVEEPAAETQAAEEEMPPADEIPVPEEAPAQQDNTAEEEPAEEPAAAEPAAEVETQTETEVQAETPNTEATAETEAEAATTAEEPATAEQSEPEQPAEGEAIEQQAADEEPAAQQATTPVAEEQAPVPMDGEEASLTDSGKEDGVTAEEEAEAASTGEAPAAAAATSEKPAPVIVTEESVPESDAAAQAAVAPQEIEPVKAEEGQEITGAAAARVVSRRPQEREGSRVVGRFGDREIVQLATGALVVATVAALAANASNNDDGDRREYVPRYRRNAERVTVEELRGGRYRETVERPNGVVLVTVYNEYGEVLRRTRVTPDGNERTLVYVPRDRWDDLRDPYYDPGDDLPPLVVRIPRDEYIFDVVEPVSEDRYYDFLAQPPVETVERLYSVDEVRRSARIRDKVRRIDLGTVNFEFGKASINDSEIDELQSLAEAMERLLERNPAETFLIEGHTDAVGSDAANLALSDARAESVASALSNVFGIPPENLETQGYGERYLKIRTEEPARENRRVSVRRITALVSPENVASAQ
nr:OmpA family protein [Notoacmeibacter sp. MSK16QG-6]